MLNNYYRLKSPLAAVLYPTLHDSKSLGKPLPRIGLVITSSIQASIHSTNNAAPSIIIVL